MKGSGTGAKIGAEQVAVVAGCAATNIKIASRFLHIAECVKAVWWRFLRDIKIKATQLAVFVSRLKDSGLNYFKEAEANGLLVVSEVMGNNAD